MSERPTISVYLDDHIADVGYYMDCSGLVLLMECCDLAKRLDGCASYSEVKERLGKLAMDSDWRSHEELMHELESNSEFPIVIDLDRRCFYYGKRGFRADDIETVGWREWIEDNGAETTWETRYGTFYDYWASAGMAVSLDDVDAVLAWLETDQRDLNSVVASGTYLDEFVIAPDLPLGELRRFAREGDAYVRAFIARATDDEDTLATLAVDPVFWVREQVATNDSTSGELLNRLVGDEVASVRLAVGQRRQVPEGIQRMLAGDGDLELRKKLARESPCYGLLYLLAGDVDEEVRKAVTANLILPDGVMATLVNDECVDVRVALAQRTSSFEEEALVKLAGDESPLVRRAVAGNSYTSAETLRALAGDESPLVRRAVAGNSYTSAETLRALADDEDPQVRCAVAAGFHTPEGVLRALADDEDPQVRCAVVTNPHTPEGVLRALADDEDPEVRCAVATSPDPPGDVLCALAEDEDYEVRCAARKWFGLDEE